MLDNMVGICMLCTLRCQHVPHNIIYMCVFYGIGTRVYTANFQKRFEGLSSAQIYCNCTPYQKVPSGSVLLVGVKDCPSQTHQASVDSHWEL